MWWFAAAGAGGGGLGKLSVLLGQLRFDMTNPPGTQKRNENADLDCVHARTCLSEVGRGLSKSGLMILYTTPHELKRVFSLWDSSLYHAPCIRAPADEA